MSFEKVEREMDAAVSRRVFPGAVLLLREGTRVFYHRAFGHRSLEPEVTRMSEDTIFDLSSLTKPFATSVAVMLMLFLNVFWVIVQPELPVRNTAISLPSKTFP